METFESTVGACQFRNYLMKNGSIGYFLNALMARVDCSSIEFGESGHIKIKHYKRIYMHQEGK